MRFPSVLLVHVRLVRRAGSGGFDRSSPSPVTGRGPARVQCTGGTGLVHPAPGGNGSRPVSAKCEPAREGVPPSTEPSDSEAGTVFGGRPPGLPAGRSDRSPAGGVRVLPGSRTHRTRQRADSPSSGSRTWPRRRGRPGPGGSSLVTRVRAATGQAARRVRPPAAKPGRCRRCRPGNRLAVRAGMERVPPGVPRPARQRFGPRLPFLVKLLTADSPPPSKASGSPAWCWARGTAHARAGRSGAARIPAPGPGLHRRRDPCHRSAARGRAHRGCVRLCACRGKGRRVGRGNGFPGHHRGPEGRRPAGSRLNSN